jgi:hypothetical protein
VEHTFWESMTAANCLGHILIEPGLMALSRSSRYLPYPSLALGSTLRVTLAAAGLSRCEAEKNATKRSHGLFASRPPFAAREPHRRRGGSERRFGGGGGRNEGAGERGG